MVETVDFLSTDGQSKAFPLTTGMGDVASLSRRMHRISGSPASPSMSWSGRIATAVIAITLLPLGLFAIPETVAQQPPAVVGDPFGLRRQSIVRRADGAIHSSGGILVNLFGTRILDDTLVAVGGIPLHDTKFLALSGHATVYFQNGYRTKDPVAVTIVDRETSKPLVKLPCGKGWMAKPLVFSSDDSNVQSTNSPD